MKKHVAFLTIFAVALAIGAFGQTSPANLRITSGPRVEGAGSNWAVVAWTTNAGGSSIVRYGTNPNSLTQTAEAPYSGAKVHGNAEVIHRVRIKNLNPGTTYYFAVDSGQGSGTGTTALSSVGQFTTQGTNASGANQGAYPYGANAYPSSSQTAGYGSPAAIRITNGPRVEGTGNDWAVVAWTTNAGGSSIIRYGTNPSSLTQTAEAPYSGANVHGQAAVTHRVRIKNLQPHTTYYFVVDSGQGSGTGTTALSSVEQFTTK